MPRKSVLLAFLWFVSCASADVRLASPFGDHGVLQRDVPIPVWGTASPGEKVTIVLAGSPESGAPGASGNAVADDKGHWRVTLSALPASAKPLTLSVSGDRNPKAITLSDILVGEVWLASGQSNMDFPVSQSPVVKAFNGVNNDDKEVASANYPEIRMFKPEGVRSADPQDTIKLEWKVCSPQTVPAFSAVGYFFARRLHKDLNVPIGIMTLSFGASTAEAWVRREALAADPQLKPFISKFDADLAQFKGLPPPATGGEQRSVDVAVKPKGRGNPATDQHNPTVLFNGMIHPVIPYAMRGVIWYQGESIVNSANGGAALYPRVQEALIRDWRSLWGEGEFPFLIVQLAALGSPSNNPKVREAQATVLKLSNTGMAVTIDIGDPKNVHPKNKQDVGDRLARIALSQTYGQPIEGSGPVLTGFKVEGATIRLTFSHATGGLVAKGGALKCLEIAGSSKTFVPAEGKIDGDTLVVSNSSVTAPVAVRYAWINYPDGCNLYNTAGLPAAPFRTDDW